MIFANSETEAKDFLTKRAPGWFDNHPDNKELLAEWVKQWVLVKKLAQLKTIQDVADVLHNQFCRGSHNDWCQYYYGAREEKKKWFEKAERTSVFAKKYNIPVLELVFQITGIIL